MTSYAYFDTLSTYTNIILLTFVMLQKVSEPCLALPHSASISAHEGSLARSRGLTLCLTIMAPRMALESKYEATSSLALELWNSKVAKVSRVCSVLLSSSWKPILLELYYPSANPFRHLRHHGIP